MEEDLARTDEERKFDAVIQVIGLQAIQPKSSIPRCRQTVLQVGIMPARNS